jgi:hypothetical protein
MVHSVNYTHLKIVIELRKFATGSRLISQLLELNSEAN